MKLNKKSILKTIGIIIGIFTLIIIGLFFFTSPPQHIVLEKDLSVHEIKINDKVGNYELVGRVWQSAETDKQKQPKGIILISHGFSSRSESMIVYASELARSGYLVVGVTHDDIPLLKTGNVLNDPMIARQRHLKLLLEQIYANSDNPNIKNLPVGLLGYSLGSFSVLNSGGLTADFSKQKSYCQTDLGKQNIIMCNPKFSERMQAIQSANNIVENELQPQAIAVLAPAYTALFDNNSLNIPTFMVYGKLDEYVNFNDVERFAQNQQTKNQQKRLENAGHYVYLPSCSFLQFGEHCDDPQEIDRESIQQEIANELVQFFDNNMKC